MLQALHLTQNDQIVPLRELRTGPTEVRGELTEVRGELTEVRVGIRTIIGLLKSTEDDEKSDDNSLN
jgi:hypothetical protein